MIKPNLIILTSIMLFLTCIFLSDCSNNHNGKYIRDTQGNFSDISYRIINQSVDRNSSSFYFDIVLNNKGKEPLKFYLDGLENLTANVSVSHYISHINTSRCWPAIIYPNQGREHHYSINYTGNSSLRISEWRVMQLYMNASECVNISS